MSKGLSDYNFKPSSYTTLRVAWKWYSN